MIYLCIFIINLKGSVFMGRKIIDLTGKDFGMFHVIKQSDEKYITESGYSLVQWDCVDKDGNEYKLLAQYLKTCLPNTIHIIKRGIQNLNIKTIKIHGFSKKLIRGKKIIILKLNIKEKNMI